MSDEQVDQLRAIRLEDAGEVLVLQRAAYVTEAQLYGDPFLPALTQTLTDLRAELHTGGGLVIRRHGRLIAAVRTSHDNGTLHVARLTVAPDLQGQGLGSRLLQAAEDSAPAAHSAVLFTGRLSLANIRLYERHGYRESHRERLTPGVELVYLRKDLAGPAHRRSGQPSDQP
jgi:predicted N-acetyltransferase YhbS